LQTKIKTPKHPSLKFELSQEAAIHNMQQIQQYNNSIHAYLLSQKGSFISFGSEFRNVTDLHLLLCHHPNWPRLRKILEEGSNWPLHPLTDSERRAKNSELIQRGNHKSAEKYNADLHNTLKKEVLQGWMIPLPIDYVSSLKYGELAPVGMDDKQWVDLPNGQKQVKLRLTHDQSFNASQGRSVNDRVITEKLEPLYYGGCLSRIIHYILSIRLRHPEIKILGGKSDIKAAYRRISLHGDTAERCTIMYNDLGLTSVRLTFGGSPCPNEFCLASELCTDLANDILHCDQWNPRELKSPHAEKIRDPVYLDSNIPYTKAKELDVILPTDDYGRIDDFIDDGIVIIPDLEDNKNRALQALLLAIHILFRPVDDNENIRRDDCLSLSKLQDEGFLTENPIILGWRINTRLLTVSLPEKKFKIWDQDLVKMITTKKTTYKELEKLIGRLNHAATACPLMRYFLNRIRKILLSWQASNHNKSVKRYLSSSVLDDLKLWQRSFLPKIKEGLSLNLISYRQPSVLSWSDACPSGMGGYDSNGIAWQFKLSPEDAQACIRQNNSLEFVAALVTIWLATKQKKKETETCFLAFCDNSSAVGWLHKANFDETKNSPLHIAARKYADVLLQADCCLYSQHIAGEKNVVADYLSRNFIYTNDQLTSFILSSFPHQVPPSFTISPLPPDILLWLTSWLRKCREREALQKIQEKKSPEFGVDGSITQNALILNQTFGYKNLPQRAEQSSSVLLQRHSGEDSFQDLTKQIWQRQQCKRPLQSWVRFLGQTWGTTPHMAKDLMHYTQHYQGSSKE
jgi:hypothetical protein